MKRFFTFTSILFLLAVFGLTLPPGVIGVAVALEKAQEGVDSVSSATKVQGNCQEVLEKTEWFAIATGGPDGPHVAGTWGEYVRRLGLSEERLLIPVGGMHEIEADLKLGSKVVILSASRQVQGANGPGKGCAIIGRGEMQTAGPDFTAVKAQFPWARAVLIVQVEQVKPQL